MTIEILNSDLMIEYETTTKDSCVNCIDNNELVKFQDRYIEWLHAKIEKENK